MKKINFQLIRTVVVRKKDTVHTAEGKKLLFYASVYMQSSKMPFLNGRPAPLRPIKGIQYGPNCQPDSGILSTTQGGRTQTGEHTTKFGKQEISHGNRDSRKKPRSRRKESGIPH